MGFFSWNCNGCGQSIKAPYQLDELEWQCKTVVKFSGEVYVGTYDGYGKVELDGGGEEEIWGGGEEPEMWHSRCWDGKFTGTPSESAADQGYFFDYDEELARWKNDERTGRSTS
jgi:hypothetical protein